MEKPKLIYKLTSNKLKYIYLHRIFSVGFLEDGNIWIEEGCDNYFDLKLSKSDAIKMFKQIIKFIEGENEKERIVPDNIQ